MPSAVIVHQGAWYSPEQPGVIRSLDRGGSSSVLTRQEGTSRLAQGPVCQSTLVEVAKHDGVAVPFDYAPVQPV